MLLRKLRACLDVRNSRVLPDGPGLRGGARKLVCGEERKVTRPCESLVPQVLSPGAERDGGDISDEYSDDDDAGEPHRSMQKNPLVDSREKVLGPCGNRRKEALHIRLLPTCPGALLTSDKCRLSHCTRRGRGGAVPRQGLQVCSPLSLPPACLMSGRAAAVSCGCLDPCTLLIHLLKYDLAQEQAFAERPEGWQKRDQGDKGSCQHQLVGR